LYLTETKEEEQIEQLEDVIILNNNNNKNNSLCMNHNRDQYPNSKSKKLDCQDRGPLGPLVEDEPKEEEELVEGD